MRLLASWVKLWRCLPVGDWIKAAEAYCNESYRIAAFYYSRALAKRPNHPASDCARLDLAYCLYRLGEKERIVSLLTPLIKSKALIPQAYLLLAKVLLQMGKSNIAISVTSRACELFPDAVDVLAVHMFSLMQGDPENLEQVQPWMARAQRLLRNSVDDRSAIDASGLDASGWGESPSHADQFLDKQKASRKSSYSRRFRAAAHLDNPSLDKQNDALLKTVIAWYEHYYGDTAKAETLLAEAVLLGADSVELYLLLADRQVEDKQIGTSRDMLCEAMRVDSSDPRPLGALAKSFLRDGVFIDPQASVHFACKACQQSSWINLEYLVVLRQAYEACGDSDAAELVSLRLEKLAIAGKMGFETVRFALANLEDLQKSVQSLAVRTRELH